MDKTYFEAHEEYGYGICCLTGKNVPPEDTGRCNNAEGCDDCIHNEEAV